ncbi:hypothetical protein FA95DRAFT_1479083, partial [Auriscalpium vulgare]
LALRQVMSQHNDSVPISRLPLEIFSHILATLSNIHPPSYRGDPSEPPTLGWITTTHVCRRWRHIALDQATLWTDVEFTLGTEWAQRMIARSQSLPITL